MANIAELFKMTHSFYVDNAMVADDLGWGAVFDLSLISDLSQKFKHDLWRVKSELKLSRIQHLTPGETRSQGISSHSIDLVLPDHLMGTISI